MKFTYDRSDGYLLDTEVENIFISEYMVTAPGEYVKVYLYTLMCAQMGQSLSFDKIAKQLSSSEEDIKKAFRYWRERGAMRVVKEGGEDIVEFTSLRSNLFYGAKKNNSHITPVSTGTGGGSSLCDEKLAEMFKQIQKIAGGPLDGKAPEEICSWIDDFGATPEIIIKAYEHCVTTYKTFATGYVRKVVKEWALLGLLDVQSVEEHLEETERRRFLHKRVFKALGFMRHPTEQERSIMDVWFGEMNLSIDKVLEACKNTSRISNPNLNYIDKILKNQYKKEGGPVLNEDGEISYGVVLKYYDYLREQEEAEAKARVEKIYAILPEIKTLDEDIRKTGMEMSRAMISAGENKKAAVLEIRQRVDRMLADKAAILTENGYPIDYMEAHYKCKVCGDTGTTGNGERCSCFKDRMNEAKEWQNSLRKKTSL